MLDNTPNQPSGFKTANCIKTNYGRYGEYNTGSQIELKTLKIRWSSCDCSDAYIPDKWTITVTNTALAERFNVIRINGSSISNRCSYS